MSPGREAQGRSRSAISQNRLRKLESSIAQKSTYTIAQALERPGYVSPTFSRLASHEYRRTPDQPKAIRDYNSLSPPPPSPLSIKNDPMLQTQLDLTHNLIKDMIEKKEAALARFERLVSTPDASVLDSVPSPSPSQSLYAKKQPSSTYKGSKNLSSFNYHIFKQDILQRIRGLCESARTSRRKDLETHLLACFNIGVGTENSACYDAWFKLMRTLEAMDLEAKNDAKQDFSCDSDVLTASYTLTNVKNRLESLEDEQRAALEGEDLLSTLEEVSRAFRLLLKKVNDRTLLQNFDQSWLLACHLMDVAVSLNDTKIKRAYSDIQRQVEEERTRIKTSLKMMSDQWQSRLEEAKRQTQKAHAMIERLQGEKAFVAELLKERETEISEIRRPEGLKEFEVVVGELGQHLEDMEVRHEAQCQLLDSISELINIKSNKRHYKRRDELGYNLVKAIAASSKTAKTDLRRGSIRVQTDALKSLERVSAEGGLRTSIASGQVDPFSPLKLVRGESTETTADMEISRPRAFSSHIAGPVPHSFQTTHESHPAAETLSRPVQSVIPESTGAYRHTGSRCNSEESLDTEESTDEKEVQTDPWQPFGTTGMQTVPIDTEPRPKAKKSGGLFALLDDEMKRQPPMLNSNVFKLFELAMLEKLKSDLSEAEQSRSPKSMSEFMLDFLFMQQGLKTLVMKSLGALLNALELLATKRHPYGLLFCRILNVFADKPFDNTLNCFLVRARAEFTDIQKSYKSNTSPKSELEFGGSALLIDIAERLMGLFPQHHSIAYEVMEKLHVAGLTEFDKSCVLFCGRLAQVGRDFKIFFIQADPQKSGEVTEDDFLKCAQDVFEVCLNREKLVEIYRFLTPNKLRFADIQKLPFKEWALKGQNRSVSVTKCSWLTTLAEVYWLEEDRLQGKLQVAYERSSKKGIRSLADFQRLVRDLEPNMHTEMTVHLYREALELSSELCEDPDLVTKAAFCEVGLRYRLGCEGLRAFSSGKGGLAITAGTEEDGNAEVL